MALIWVDEFLCRFAQNVFLLATFGLLKHLEQRQQKHHGEGRNQHRLHSCNLAWLENIHFHREIHFPPNHFCLLSLLKGIEYKKEPGNS